MTNIPWAKSSPHVSSKPRGARGPAKGIYQTTRFLDKLLGTLKKTKQEGMWRELDRVPMLATSLNPYNLEPIF